MSERELEPYQQRVVEEKSELDGRFARLCMFCDSEEFHKLGADERCRLREQALAMERYSSILEERIAAF